MLRIVSRTVVMIREPPGLPSTRKTRPSFSTSVGDIDESGRMPGMIAFASPWTRPSRFGTPGFTVKSSISLSERSRSRADHTDAEAVVDRVGHHNRIALAVDDRVMGRLGFLFRRLERRHARW